jgi:hypothetical protein
MYLVIALLVGALIIAIVDRWRKRHGVARVDSGDQMAHFRALYERGELSKEEFEQIRARLGVRMRRELRLSTHPEVDQVKNPPPPPEAPPPAAGQPPPAPEPPPAAP